MNKVKILTVSFLIATSLSSIGVAQQAPSAAVGGSASDDVAGLINRIYMAFSKMQTSYRNLKTAHDAYVTDPSDANYKKLNDAALADAQAANDYKQIVATTSEAKVKAAEQMYYEETPATKQEIEQAPPVLKGETVEKRMGESEQQIIEELSKEVTESGGGLSPFAKALQDQANKLKSTQARVQAEASKVNPTASQQDTSLGNALGRAIDARMQVVFCANNSEKKCCAKYPTYPKCSDKSKM